MPYIKPEDRQRVTVTFGPKGCPQTAGELNFFFTMVTQRYLKEHGVSYQRINDCLGALEGCKLELYRRIVAPYEDNKIAENGDVNLLSNA
jgi:hypothetical protein